MATRVKLTFAGITFSAIARGRDIGDYLTVPKPAFVKIIGSGNVNVVCNYNHSDEAAYRHPTGPVEPSTLLSELDGDCKLITFVVKKGEISFSPHSGKGYTVSQK